MQATNLYALNHEQTFNLIHTTGHKRTFVVEGDIGCGKTSLLKMFREREVTTPSGLPYEAFVYFDSTTKEAGDLFVPDLISLSKEQDKDNRIVKFAPHEDLGLHIDGPIVVLLDEIGKATLPVKNGLMRICLERTMGGLSYHPETIVFATSNLTGEGTGDTFLPHQYDRMDFIRLLKGDNLSWINWAINHGIDDNITAFAYETPELFQSFTEVTNPEDNEYIFHPQAPERRAFVTNRGLAEATHVVSKRHLMDDHTLQAALSACWGYPAAAAFMANMHLRDKMPSQGQIKADPQGTPVPDNDAAKCALIFRALRTMTRDFLPSWMTYIGRFDHGMQVLFCTSAVDVNYRHKDFVVQNNEFRQWAMRNKHVFDADIVK